MSPQEDALRHPTPKRYDSIGCPLPHPSALPDPDPHFVRSQPTGGEPPPYNPDRIKRYDLEVTDCPEHGPVVDLMAELERAAYHFRHAHQLPDTAPLTLGFVRIEPWRWWMRFVPGRPRTVHHLRSFPPGPTQDEDARAWWSLS